MIEIHTTSTDLAKAAASHAGQSLRSLLDNHDTVRLLAATGASQLEFLDQLALQQDIAWDRVELFHLDEYVGVDQTHPASFAGYIKQRIVDRLGIRQYHLLDGTKDPEEVAAEMGRAIVASPIQLAFVGIGENGHLAFNDPPADFEADEPYLAVDLDHACRLQQVGEGWFRSLDEVPARAITISIPQLLQTREILCVVPDRRKATAVRACLEGPVSPAAPASALRAHPNTTIFLDRESASLLKKPVPEPIS